MEELKKYGLPEIKRLLAAGDFPFSGITELGSTEFHFREPVRYLAVVLHSGNRVRPEMIEIMDVTGEDRSREEDLYMDLFVKDFPIHLIARDSRFEYDLNWEIEKAIYPFDGKKWGLRVWKRYLDAIEAEESYKKYREFHALLELVLDHIMAEHRCAILFDIHSFCYQRENKVKWWEDSKPEINLGTRYINRDFFSPLIDLFLDGMSGATLDGQTLRIVENDIFPGGYLTRKFARSHNRQVLVLAIEYKKIYMDERTGELFNNKLHTLKENLLLTKDRLFSEKF